MFGKPGADPVKRLGDGGIGIGAGKPNKTFPHLPETCAADKGDASLFEQ